MVSKFKLGIVYSNFSFFVTILIGIFSYKYLWNILEPDVFNSWIALFEFSLFLLLLDLGFTHSFIKKYSGVDCLDKVNFEKDILHMRYSLFKMAFFSLVLILILGVTLNISEKLGGGPVLILGISVFLTLISYADTAVLKINEKFNIIYIINIISNIVYLSLLFVFPESWGVWMVVVCVFIRSLLIYLLQSLYTPFSFRLKKYKQDIKTEYHQVFFLNSSYFIYFAFDAILLINLSISPVVLSILIVYKKYYDLLRGFFDSMLSVIIVYFSKFNSKSLNISVFFTFFVIIAYLLSFLLSEYLLKFWFDDFLSNLLLSLSVCFSTLSIVLYRYFSNKLYFTTKNNLIYLLICSVLVKSIFVLYYLFCGNLASAYIVQALFVFLICFIISRFIINDRESNG